MTPNMRFQGPRVISIDAAAFIAVLIVGATVMTAPLAGEGQPAS